TARSQGPQKPQLWYVSSALIFPKLMILTSTAALKSEAPAAIKTPYVFNQAGHVERRIEAIKERALQAINFQVGAKRKYREADLLGEELNAPRQKRNTYRLRPERHVANFWARAK